MDASVDQSDGECKGVVWFLLKKEPGPWIARNPGRLSEVLTLELELPDHVYTISDSIVDLLNLKQLFIRRGINLNCLPHTLPTLLNLMNLQLENCPNLSQLPSNFGNLVALRILLIQNCGIKFLPQSLSLIDLAHLTLINCVFIRELPAGLAVETLRLVGCHVKSFSAKPRYLDCLEINNCLYFNNILNSLNHFDSLHTLKITGCDMESLPNSITRIHSLKSLEINSCLYVNDILTTLNHFHSLHTLHIKGCHMESLPNSITVIHDLKKLDIEDCINLRRLPQNLSQLADLTLINCGLESIPSGLRSLTSLSIQNCSMEFLVIKESVSLIDVTIKSCNIKSLDGCITGLTKLERLSILYCVVLEDLPTDINTLVSLETLCIEGCKSIKFLPSLAALHNLKQLSLKGCSRLNELPADMDELTILKTLNLTDTNVQSLPSTIAKLPSFDDLTFLETLLRKLDLKEMDIYLPLSFRLETLLPNDFDRKRNHIFLPLSFRLDTLPPKFSVIRLVSAYRLRLKDQKESRLELINGKECDVDDADKSNGYWQTMVNMPPNVTHLPQPRPGICTNLDGEACPEESRQAITHNQNPLNGHLNLALTLQPFTIPEESWHDVFDDQTNSEKTLNLLDAFHIPDDQVLAGTPGYLDVGRSSLQSAFLNPDIGRNHMGFAHDGDGPSEYLHGKNKHIMNNSRVMSQRESRDSESIDSTSHSVTSKALSKEATSLLRTEKRTKGKAVDDGHRMKQRKSQIGTSDGRCESKLSSTQDKMYTVWAKPKENEINFKFKVESSFAAVKQELAERLSIFVVNAIYKDALVSFNFLSTSSIAKLKEEVLLRLPLEENKIKIKYQDDEDDWVLLACPRDLQHCLRLSTKRKSNIIRVMIFDS